MIHAGLIEHLPLKSVSDWLSPYVEILKYDTFAPTMQLKTRYTLVPYYPLTYKFCIQYKEASSLVFNWTTELKFVLYHGSHRIPLL